MEKRDCNEFVIFLVRFLMRVMLHYGKLMQKSYLKMCNNKIIKTFHDIILTILNLFCTVTNAT